MRQIISIGPIDTCGMSCEVVSILAGTVKGTIEKYPCGGEAAWAVTFVGMSGINHQRLCERHAKPILDSMAMEKDGMK